MDHYITIMNREEIRQKFADVETTVFWDVEDFPVTDILWFDRHIRNTLCRAGYCGRVSIMAYGDKKRQLEFKRKAVRLRIDYVPTDSKRARMHSMLVDMHFWAADNRASKLKNVMVMAKNIMPADDYDDTGFSSNLRLMNQRCYNVLLAVPDDYQLEKLPVRCNYTVWRWSGLLGGDYPVDPSLVFRLSSLPPPQDIEAEGCSLCGK